MKSLQYINTIGYILVISTKLTRIHPIAVHKVRDWKVDPVYIAILVHYLD